MTPFTRSTRTVVPYSILARTDGQTHARKTRSARLSVPACCTGLLRAGVAARSCSWRRRPGRWSWHRSSYSGTYLWAACTISAGRNARARSRVGPRFRCRTAIRVGDGALQHRRSATFEKRCGHIRSLPPFFIASLSFLPGNQQHGGERCEQQASRAAPVVHISPMSTIDLLALFGAELPLVLALRMCRMCHSGQTSVSWCSAILTS